MDIVPLFDYFLNRSKSWTFKLICIIDIVGRK